MPHLPLPFVRFYLLVDCGGTDEDRDVVWSSVRTLITSMKHQSVGESWPHGWNVDVEFSIIGFGDGARWLARSADPLPFGWPALGHQHDLGAAVDLLRPELAVFPTPYEMTRGSHVVAFLRGRSTGPQGWVNPLHTRYAHEPERLVTHGIVCVRSEEIGSDLHAGLENDLEGFAASIRPLKNGSSEERLRLYVAGDERDVGRGVDWEGVDRMGDTSGSGSDEDLDTSKQVGSEHPTADDSDGLVGDPSWVSEVDDAPLVSSDKANADGHAEQLASANKVPQVRLMLDGGRFVTLDAAAPLRRCEFGGSAGDAEAEIAIAQLSKHPEQDLWGLTNLGAATWSATLLDGTAQVVDSGRTVLARVGTRIDFGDGNWAVILELPPSSGPGVVP